MDINKEREAFESWAYSKKWNISRVRDHYVDDFVNGAWHGWQAKAQAVPEGFVLINKSDRNQEMLELIDQRDYMESQAEELKDKLQALYGVDFGEHSNCNFPFQNAIDYDDSDLVLVPKEPTLLMQRAGSAEAIKPNLGIASMRDIYKAMIEAQEPTND